jgi:hypothetical protein
MNFGPPHCDGCDWVKWIKPFLQYLGQHFSKGTIVQVDVDCRADRSPTTESGLVNILEPSIYPFSNDTALSLTGRRSDAFTMVTSWQDSLTAPICSRDRSNGFVPDPNFQTDAERPTLDSTTSTAQCQASYSSYLNQVSSLLVHTLGSF